LEENFPDANLFSVQIVDDYFSHVVGFLSTGMAPKEFTIAHKKIVGSARCRLPTDCRSFIQVSCRWNHEMMGDGA
jgi:hypothetical protein